MTTEEKDEIKKAVLADIQAESQDVSELEVVNTLDGVQSLPTMKGGQLVSAPVNLLSKPATDAAAKAEVATQDAIAKADSAVKEAIGRSDAATQEAKAKTDAAAQKATDAAAKADTATSSAQTAAQLATDAAAKATKSAEAADAAAERAEAVETGYKEVAISARDGATARFDGFVEDVTIEQVSVIDVDGVFFDTARLVFVGRSGTNYVNNWGKAGLYMDDSRTSVLKDKVYLHGASIYAWSEDDGTLSEVSGSGSGSGFYNVTNEQPLSNGFYTKQTAIAALANAKIKDEDKPGMILTFELSAGVWADYRFTASSIDKFLTPESWEEYGGGKIKSISLNGSEIAPDGNGNVSLNIDQIAVDESLDQDSTNPVQNKVITAKVNEISDAAIGGMEVIESEDKNTINIRNKKGTVIASAEFSGGGGGGGSTASQILISASVDKKQVKEGDNVQLSYTYNHVNSSGDSDGIKADITITISRGTTQTYQVTTKNVSAGSYTLDVSDYLLVGVTDINVDVVAITEDGTKQTKRAYASVTVVTLKLTSSYNLGSTIVGGGYKNGETIEIPFTITGSGTKDVSMHVDGSSTPVSQTISKSGTVNGSFTINASTLSAGRHTVQLVAERDGLKSDSIFMDILKAGNNEPFIGVKYTDKTGTILTTNHLSPSLPASQYDQTTFAFIAYDPETTPALVEVYLNEKLTNTINAPRSMQYYTNRFTTKGKQTLLMKVGTKSYLLGIEVAESSINLNEATYGLVAKFDAAGRSNSESNPAQWESGGITTDFQGFDWSSNGWTGDSLKLTNGAKIVFDYKPFERDVKATGLTIEMTVKVSRVMKRSANVISCIDNGKGLLVTSEEASFKTGQTITYTNEDDEQVTREIKLGTNFVPDKYHKIALAIDTKDNHRLMHLYVNGNRTGADIYDNSFNFAQDNPQKLSIESSEADVEVKNVRIYRRAISDDEELDNNTVDADTSDEMMALFDENNILGDTGGVDIDKIRAKGKGVLRIVRANKLDDVYAENNKKTDFKADIYFASRERLLPSTRQRIFVFTAPREERHFPLPLAASWILTERIATLCGRVLSS